MHSPVEDHDLVPSLPDSLNSQTHFRVSECDGQPSVQVEPSPVNRMATASAGVQTDLPKWFTPHVDLFATHLNHKLPLYVSPVPDPKAWDIDALNINWTGLTAYTSVKNSSQTVPQLRVSQQSTTSQPPCPVSRSGQLQNKASLWRWQRELLPLKGHQQGPSTSQSGPYLRNGAEKIRWISPLPL